LFQVAGKNISSVPGEAFPEFAAYIPSDGFMSPFANAQSRALTRRTPMIRFAVAVALTLTALTFAAGSASAGDGNDYRPGQVDGRYSNVFHGR
jgi:hypothetical protein